MFDKAFQFLKEHKEVAFATSEGNFPKLRIFQIMKQEGHVLYFATSVQKAVYRELRQNPNVEILAYADNISVRCSGMVNFNVEDDVKRWIYDANSRDGLLRFISDAANISAFRPHCRSSWTRFRRRKIQEQLIISFSYSPMIVTTNSLEPP